MNDEVPQLKHTGPVNPDLPTIARRVHESIEALAVSVNTLNTRIGQSERRTLILAVSLALSVLLTLAVIVLGYQMHSTSRCQDTVNTEFRAAITERDTAATRDRVSMRQLLDAILTPDATPEQRAAALVRYREGLLSADRQRIENPLPTGNC